MYQNLPIHINTYQYLPICTNTYKYIQIFKENVPDTWFKVDTSGDRKLMSNNAETDHGVFVKWIKPEKNKYFLLNTHVV